MLHDKKKWAPVHQPARSLAPKESPCTQTKHFCSIDPRVSPTPICPHNTQERFHFVQVWVRFEFVAISTFPVHAALGTVMQGAYGARKRHEHRPQGMRSSRSSFVFSHAFAQAADRKQLWRAARNALISNPHALCMSAAALHPVKPSHSSCSHHPKPMRRRLLSHTWAYARTCTCVAGNAPARCWRAPSLLRCACIPRSHAV